MNTWADCIRLMMEQLNKSNILLIGHKRIHSGNQIFFQPKNCVKRQRLQKKTNPNHLRQLNIDKEVLKLYQNGSISEMDRAETVEVRQEIDFKTNRKKYSKL